MPARKDAPDVASFQHIHVISAQLVKPSAASVESKVTISQCRSATTLATVQTDIEPFLGTLEEISTHKNKDQWMVELQLNRN